MRTCSNASSCGSATSVDRAPLFQIASDLPLLVSCNCPFEVCNYRCHYCYLDHDNPKPRPVVDAKFAKWVDLMGRIIEIPRPLYLCLGTVGEPMAHRRFWDVLRVLSPLDKVKGFWFPTNLSRPLEKVAHGIDPRKLGLTGSFHPSEFRNPERDTEFFLRQCEWLKERGGSVFINYILSPDQIDRWAEYNEMFKARGLEMTANVFKGVYQGKTYPQAYTPQQREIIEQIFKSRPFIFKYMSGTSSRGVSCTAGRDVITVDLDGTVYNCQFAKVKLGHITDPELSIYTTNRPCTTDWCKCHWTIGFMEENVRRFRRTRSVFHFDQREHGQQGWQAFL